MKIAGGIIVFSWITLLAFQVGAESARNLVERGNELYRAGDYDQALADYEEALAELPEAGEILLNKGNVHFQKGEYEKAREAYQAAAIHTKDLALEASALYNMGSTVFAEGQKELENDPKKTLSQWGQSIEHYQEALRIDPQLKEAAQNIEVVRLALKDLADRLKKAEEAAREQQKQQEELRKELEEVIREQEGEIGQNDALREKATQIPAESLSAEAQALASDQDNTRRKTGKIADRLKELQAQGRPSPQQPDAAASAAEEHLKQAWESQGSAVEKLAKTELSPARQDQEEALRHLKEALSSPDAKDKQGQCPNPQAGDQSAKEGDKGKPEEEASPKEQSGEKTGKDEKAAQQQAAEEKPQAGGKEREEKGDEPKAGAAFSESPENILREEKEHRLELQRAQQGSYKPVDKDW